MFNFYVNLAGHDMFLDIAGLPGAGANSKPYHYKQNYEKRGSFRKNEF